MLAYLVGGNSTKGPVVEVSRNVGVKERGLKDASGEDNLVISRAKVSIDSLNTSALDVRYKA